MLLVQHTVYTLTFLSVNYFTAFFSLIFQTLSASCHTYFPVNGLSSSYCNIYIYIYIARSLSRKLRRVLNLNWEL